MAQMLVADGLDVAIMMRDQAPRGINLTPLPPVSLGWFVAPAHYTLPRPAGIDDLAGLPIPDTHTGRSLKPLLKGKPVADWRRDFLCEFLAVPQTIPRWEGVRDTDWVYARYYVDGADKPPFEFLYDLRDDPDQLTNLALQEQKESALQRMRNRCDELVAENGPSMKDVGGVKRPTRKKK